MGDAKKACAVLGGSGSRAAGHLAHIFIGGPWRPPVEPPPAARDDGRRPEMGVRDGVQAFFFYTQEEGGPRALGRPGPRCWGAGVWVAPKIIGAKHLNCFFLKKNRKRGGKMRVVWGFPLQDTENSSPKPSQKSLMMWVWGVVVFEG